MRRKMRLLATTFGWGLMLALPASAAASTTTTCTGELAPGSYGRVVVPEGAACLSEGPVTIHGGLVVGSGATFVLGSDEVSRDSGTITSGVRADDAASVQLQLLYDDGG